MNVHLSVNPHGDARNGNLEDKGHRTLGGGVNGQRFPNETTHVANELCSMQIRQERQN